jgi:hypothetical protein
LVTPAVPNRLHAQVDQVGRARQLDHGEHRHRPLDQRPDPERDRGHLRVDPDLTARGGGHPGGPAQLQRSADHEEHVRSRHHDQGQGEKGKGQQMTRGKHPASIAAGRPPRAE